jgi:menaquinol-cytochrome c reductase iron-sulfur subunit
MYENKNDDLSVTRRKFMKLASGSIVIVSSVLLGIPFLGSIINPGLRKITSSFSKVGDLKNIQNEQPVNIPFLTSSKDAYLDETEMHNVWIVKNSNENITVFSPICPHLGCAYNWNSSDHHFECPCHGSVFDINGKLLSGPAPRNLDTLPIKIKDDMIFVEWEKFQVGTEKKIII